MEQCSHGTVEKTPAKRTTWSRYLGQILGLSQQIVAVMNLLRVSQRRAGERLRGVWLLGKSSIWVNGALAQMRTNMFLCVCVFRHDYTCDWVCVYMWNYEFMCVCPVSCIFVCWCVQQNWSCFIQQANSITAGWMFGPLALCSKTHDPLKCCLLTSDQPVVSLSCRQKYVPAGPGRSPFSRYQSTC